MVARLFEVGERDGCEGGAVAEKHAKKTIEQEHRHFHLLRLHPLITHWLFLT